MQQNEFAKDAGISPSTYNEYETGEARPSVDKARLLRKQYGLTLDWIFDGDLSGLRHELAEAIKALRKSRVQPKDAPPKKEHKSRADADMH